MRNKLKTLQGYYTARIAILLKAKDKLGKDDYLSDYFRLGNEIRHCQRLLNRVNVSLKRY